MPEPAAITGAAVGFLVIPAFQTEFIPAVIHLTLKAPDLGVQLRTLL
jgi:hypothetical protein